MQVGPFGKLYLAENSKQTIAVINNPNALGASCNFVANAISLGTGTCQLGLPNFMGSAFREKAKTSLSKTCGSASFSYTPPAYCANASYSVNSVQWSFGDPASGASNTSSLDNPVHVYPANGTYTAQLTVQYDCYSDVIEQVVTIDGYPNLTINGRESICTNESTTLTASGAATYSWSPGANTASISLSPSITTIYTVTGSGTNGACASSKILTVSVLPCTNLLENPLNESVFLIYPNPSNTEVTVEADSDGSVSFINTLGQKVLTQAIHSGKNKLTISDLSLGIYFVIGKTENSEVVLRFVKE
jgi:PKD repeat protein